MAAKLNNFRKYFFLIVYTLLFKHFPRSSLPIFGKPSMKLRYLCCKQIFKKCGVGVNIECGASFGNGFELEIGNNSGLGRYCHVPPNIKIGNDVMMAPHVFVLDVNHDFERTDIPMNKQGYVKSEGTIIEDDVWIGMRVLIMPGKHVRKGSIVGAGCVLTKTFPEYSVIGGNPSRLIRNRIDEISRHSQNL